MTFNGGLRVSLRDSLNVFVLVVLVVAQPVLTILGSNTLFFLVRRSDTLEVFSLLFVLCFLLPAAASLSVLLAYRISPFVGRLAGASLVGLCASLFFAPILKELDTLVAWQQVNVNVFLGALVAALYAFWQTLRRLVTYMIPAVLLVPLVFWCNAGLQQALDQSDPEQSAQTVGQPNDVVIVVLDSFPLSSLLTPEREVDARRFPHIAKLAESSTWYRNASTINETTWWAVPSLLTGRELFGETRLPVYSSYPRNLFTALGDDYDFNVTEYISTLCPPDLCRIQAPGLGERLSKFLGLLQDSLILYKHAIFPEAFAGSLPRIGETLGGFVHGNVAFNTKNAKDIASPNAIMGRFIETLSAAEEPQLFFLHALIPHAPWRYTPSGKEYGAGYFSQIHGLNGLEKRWSDDQWAVNLAYQRHLMQVGYADFQIGRLIARLKSQGMYDNALLIVVSDHGNSYRTGEFHRRASDETLPDLLGVPLFVKYPNQTAGQIDDRNATILDVVPTIFEQLQVNSDWTFDGMSLLPEWTSKRSAQRTGKRFRDQKQRVFEVQEDYYIHSTTVAEKYALLETGESLGEPFGISLIPALNGIAVSNLPVAQSSDEFFVHNPDQFLSVDLESSYAPVFVSGEAKNVSPNTPLAIALNGEIVAVTKVFSDKPARAGFAAMLPESRLLQGENVLSIFRVEQRDKSWVLYRSIIEAL